MKNDKNRQKLQNYENEKSLFLVKSLQRKFK